MISFLSDFHFLRPWFLLLAIFPVLLYAFYGSASENQTSWRKVIDARLLNFLLIKNSAYQRKFYTLIAFIGLLLSTFILAGPSWEKKEIPSLQKQNPVIVILNLSSDMNETDLKPNRLERAKYKINDFLSLLKSTQTSLEVYTDEPYVIAPLTEDAAIIQNLLPKISFDIMPSNGDRLDRAIEMGVSRLHQAQFKQGSLVVFAPDVGQKFNLAIEAAKKSAQAGIDVNIINTSATSNDKLEMVASSGSGIYKNLQSDDNELKQIAEHINQRTAPIQESNNSSLQWLDSGWSLLLIPLICCLLLFRKGIVCLIFIMGISEAQAGFFTNANQDALNYFQQQDYQASAEKFNNINWKAASLYRLGQYSEAYKYYSQDNSADGLYNQGNALAKSGKIKEAISKYEEVLKINPNHDDAKFNLEYLKQQQQNQSSDQNNNSDKNNQDSQNQDQNQNQNQDQDQNQDQNNNSSGDNDENQEQSPSQKQQSQSASSEENSDDNNQSENNPSQSDEIDSNSDNNDSSDNPRDNTSSQSSRDTDYLDEDQTSPQGNPSSSAQMEAEEGDDENYDEKVQAKTQRYREIPEDVGGLLRAFIHQEYQKNRYNEK